MKLLNRQSGIPFHLSNCFYHPEADPNPAIPKGGDAGDEPINADTNDGFQDADFSGIEEEETGADTHRPAEGTKSAEDMQPEADAKKAEDDAVAAGEAQRQQAPQDDAAKKESERIEHERIAKEKEPGGDKKIPADDKDLDEVVVRPGDPKWIREKVPVLKTQIKEAREIARKSQIEATENKRQLDELKSKPALDETTQKELDELRTFRASMDIEHDPSINTQFNEKLSTTDADILDYLQDLGLPKETAEKMKERGLGNMGQKWWDDTLQKISSPLKRRQLEDKLLTRDQIVAERNKKIADVSANRDKYVKERQEGSAKAWSEWGDKAKAAAVKLTTGREWATKKEIPATATPEVIASLTAHNTRQESLEKTVVAKVDELTRLSPDAVVEAAIAIAEINMIREELTTTKKDAADKDARIKDLEAELKSITDGGRLSRRTAAPVVKPKGKEPEGSDILNESAEEAMERIMGPEL